MANSTILPAVAMILNLLATVPILPAQSVSSGRAGAIASAPGFRTERLTPKQIRIWREIEKIAQARDKAGRPLHPRLHSLWERIQSSGHTAFIEMVERQAPTCAGGKTIMENAESDGNCKTVVIWLNLWAMNALINPTVRRSDGLIPFYRLDKYERYAEVVGHELAHAVLMLENPGYARLCSEYGSESAELLVMRSKGRNAADDEEIQQRRRQLQSLTDKIEKPAEMAELEIWRELRSGQRRGTRTGVVAENAWTPVLMDQSPAN
jgi:hypothetical protein